MLPPDLQRLQHMEEYCQAIQKTMERYGQSFDIFDADPDYQRSVTFCILQIGELSVGLSQQFKDETAQDIQWAAVRGMANLVAHSYGTMDRRIIWETACQDIPALLAFCPFFSMP